MHSCMLLLQSAQHWLCLDAASTAQRAGTLSRDNQRVMPSRLPLASAAHFLDACTRSTACNSRCRWKLASLHANALLAQCPLVQQTLL